VQDIENNPDCQLIIWTVHGITIMDFCNLFRRTAQFFLLCTIKKYL
jgi:hypothetical protein